MGQFHDTSYCWWKVTRRGARERYNAAVAVRNKIRKHEPVFRAFLKARANADVAVLATEGNRAWNEFQPRPESAFIGGAVKAYAYVGALGRQWKYVLTKDISRNSVGKVLIVAAPWLRPATLAKINDLPEDRRIIVVNEIPTTDEYCQSLPKSELKQFRDRCVVVQEWENLEEKVSPLDGLMSPYTEIGQGKFWWWHGFRGRSRWHYKLPTAKLEVRRVTHDGHLYVAVVNHADTSVTARVPWSEGKDVRALIGGNIEKKEGGDKYVFGGEAVALFEIR